jgi:hypothetical protein
MSLRTYFDNAMKKDESAEQRRAALGMTVKKGEDAARHLKDAKASLAKIRAGQARKKACA